MGDLIPKNTDDEMERYNEADMIRRARIPMENNAALVYEVDPVSKREVALFPLSSGGYVKIGDRAVTPAQAAETDVLAAQATVQNDGRTPIGMVLGGIATGPNAEGVRIDPTMEDYASAGYTEAEVIEYQNQKAVSPTTQFAVQLAPEQVQMGVDVGAPMLTTRDATKREGATEFLSGAGEGAASQFLREVYEAIGLDEFEARRLAEAVIGNPNSTRDFGFGLADLTPAGIIFGAEEGYNTFQRGLSTDDPLTAGLGALEAGLSVLEAAPMVGAGVRGLRELATPAMREAINTLRADAIGAGRAIMQGDTEMLGEVFQPSGTPTSLGAAAPDPNAAGAETTAQNITLAPASQEPMVGQLAPQYRVRVEGFTPEGTGRQSFIPRKLTPNNSQATIQKMSALTEEFPDPLSSPESYAGMMARVRNESEVPAPPTWMIENANNMEKWSGWFNGLTPDQIRAADNGLAVQNDFRSAYRGGAGPELTGQLMLWSILSRMLSAFPHESGFLDLAENATPFIQRAARGEWTDADTQAWLKMVPATIPPDSPGRSATSNANAFGETFLRKMAATDENGRSALLRLHEMIADPNMSSAEIRRQYYGLAEDTGIANKILSFALLVSGRNDVVVLDRIQINRMWAGGDKVYDDIMGQFEGAQGLAQYEALERSLAPRINDLYRMAGREGEGSVGRYHWESWVLSSGQVVSHPTLGSVVRAGEIAPGATTRSPVMEGRFHRWNYGVRYEKMPEGGNRYVYETSTGEPFQFTKAELDAMFKDVQKRSSGVLPPSFPGVSSFEGGNIPWYQYEGVNRERLDEIIRQSGKPVTE